MLLLCVTLILCVIEHAVILLFYILHNAKVYHQLMPPSLADIRLDNKLF
ncbi:hypothetical protein T07_2105 [Trichinella nelsoni]|uniref:Uncharacterized protein n=1 Tax=Trichinella nelsoni TaxID=6336 RepID=A0A0V0RCY5_9BILA|nr:hypothetical protein T07_2105 [Trichinella nelsoni]